jgi:hypothetical protein
MDIWTRVIGVIVALYAVYVIYRGQVASGDENSTTYIKRSEKPVQFWISVAFMLVVAALMIFNVFHF